MPPLAPLTTFKVGGPADWLVEPAERRRAGRGAAASCSSSACRSPCSAAARTCSSPTPASAAWWCGPGAATMQLVGRDIVRADAGVTINGLVRWTISRGLAGLEAWAGTPGTVGGAIYGNAHWRQAQHRRASSRACGWLTRDGGVRQVPADRHGLRLRHEPAAADRRDPDVGGVPRRRRATIRTPCAPWPAPRWRSASRRSRWQSPSAGCIFQNPRAGARRGAGGHSARRPAPWSIGPGSRGTSIGGARVSPVHANFIVNDGTATAHGHRGARRPVPRDRGRTFRRARCGTKSSGWARGRRRAEMTHVDTDDRRRATASRAGGRRGQQERGAAAHGRDAC